MQLFFHSVEILFSLIGSLNIQWIFQIMKSIECAGYYQIQEKMRANSESLINYCSWHSFFWDISLNKIHVIIDRKFLMKKLFKMNRNKKWILLIFFNETVLILRKFSRSRILDEKITIVNFIRGNGFVLLLKSKISSERSQF